MSSSSNRDDVLSFLESLDNPPQDTTAATRPGSSLGRASTPMSTANGAWTQGRSESPSRGNIGGSGASPGRPVTSTDTQSVLDFLDEIGASTSGATAAVASSAFRPDEAPGAPSAISDVDVSSTGETLAPQRLTSASPTAPRFSTTSSRPSQGTFQAFRLETAPQPALPPQASPSPAMNTGSEAPTATTDADTSSGGGAWSWGGLLAVGAKVVKSSEEALKKTSEVALRNVAAESDKVRSYVNTDALGKLGGDLKKMTIDSVNSVVNTIVPPIPGGHLHSQQYERLVCYATTSALLVSGGEWMDACAFRMFHAALEECSLPTRRGIGYADVDAEPVSLEGVPCEKEMVVDGHNAGAEAVKISLSRLKIQKPPSAKAPAETAEDVPAFSCIHEIYLAVEPFQFKAQGTPAFISYAASLSDPARSLELLNFSQASPMRFLARLGESERRDVAIECVEGAVKTLWREWFDAVLKASDAVEQQHGGQQQHEQQEIATRVIETTL